MSPFPSYLILVQLISLIDALSMFFNALMCVYFVYSLQWCRLLLLCAYSAILCRVTEMFISLAEPPKEIIK